MKMKKARGEKAKPITAAQLKAAGKASLKAGRSNRKSSLGSIKTVGKTQIKAGRALKKKGRQVKRAVNKTARVAKRAVNKTTRAVNKMARGAKRAVKKDTRVAMRKAKKAVPSAAALAAFKAKQVGKAKQRRITMPPVKFVQAQDKKKGTFKPRKK